MSPRPSPRSSCASRSPRRRRSPRGSSTTACASPSVTRRSHLPPTPWQCGLPRSCMRSGRPRDDADPQGAAIDLDAGAGKDLALPVKRQVVRELGHQHMGDGTLGRQPALDQPRRGDRLGEPIRAGTAGILRPDVDQHTKPTRLPSRTTASANFATCSGLPGYRPRNGKTSSRTLSAIQTSSHASRTCHCGNYRALTRILRLALQNGSAFLDLTGRHHIDDFYLNKITTAQLAVDSQIEECQIPVVLGQFKPNADRLGMFGFEWSFLTDDPALVPGRAKRANGG